MQIITNFRMLKTQNYINTELNTERDHGGPNQLVEVMYLLPTVTSELLET